MHYLGSEVSVMRVGEKMTKKAAVELDPRHSPRSEVDTTLTPCFDAVSHQVDGGGASEPKSVRIPLGKSGRFALVDARDAERVRQFRWRPKTKRSQPGKVYAQRSLPRAERGTITNQTLHAFVLGLPSSQYIDHWDGDGLNNQRLNLRPCTPRENATNVTSSKRQKLGGFKGVTWNKAATKWQASICGGEIKANGKRRQLYLGVFTDPVAAARAYDAKALEVFGPFASLNLPDPEAEQFAIAMGEASEVRGLDDIARRPTRTGAGR